MSSRLPNWDGQSYGSWYVTLMIGSCVFDVLTIAFSGWVWAHGPDLYHTYGSQRPLGNSVGPSQTGDRVLYAVLGGAFWSCVRVTGHALTVYTGGSQGQRLARQRALGGPQI